MPIGDELRKATQQDLLRGTAICLMLAYSPGKGKQMNKKELNKLMNISGGSRIQNLWGQNLLILSQLTQSLHGLLGHYVEIKKANR